MILLLARKIEISVQDDDGKQSLLELTRSLPEFPRRLLFLQDETLSYRREILR